MIAVGCWVTTVTAQYFKKLNQDLSYGEILAGRPVAWLMKEKNIVYAYNQKR